MAIGLGLSAWGGSVEAATGVGVEAAAATPSGDAPQKNLPTAFAGSTLILRSQVSALSLRRDQDLTYNPYAGVSGGLQLRYRMSKALVVHGDLGFAAEFTHPDADNRHVDLTDSTLGLSFPSLFTATGLGVAVGVELGLRLPTSRAARAATQLGAGHVQVLLSRRAGALGLRIGARGQVAAHRRSVGAAVARLPGCSALSDDCIIYSGRRNANRAMALLLGASYDVAPSWTLSVQGAASRSWLMALAPVQGLSWGVPDPDDTVETAFFELASTFVLTDGISLGVGTTALYAQLAPDGSQRAIGFNRATRFFLDLRYALGGAQHNS